MESPGSFYRKQVALPTRQRDMHRLREMEFVFLDTENHLWPGFIRPKNVKLIGKKEA